MFSLSLFLSLCLSDTHTFFFFLVEKVDTSNQFYWLLPSAVILHTYRYNGRFHWQVHILTASQPQCLQVCLPCLCACGRRGGGGGGLWVIYACLVFTCLSVCLQLVEKKEAWMPVVCLGYLFFACSVYEFEHVVYVWCSTAVFLSLRTLGVELG